MTLDYTSATAVLQEDGSVKCMHEILSPVGKCLHLCVVLSHETVCTVACGIV